MICVIVVLFALCWVAVPAAVAGADAEAGAHFMFVVIVVVVFGVGCRWLLLLPPLLLLFLCQNVPGAWVLLSFACVCLLAAACVLAC